MFIGVSTLSLVRGNGQGGLSPADYPLGDEATLILDFMTETYLLPQGQGALYMDFVNDEYKVWSET